MVAVVAAVGRQIEGDGKAFLAGGDVAPIKGVGIFRRGKPRILPDGPGLGYVHGGVGPAQIGRNPGVAIEEVEAGAVGGLILRLDGDPLRREPGLARGGTLPAAGGSPGQTDLAEIGDPAHDPDPWLATWGSDGEAYGDPNLEVPMAARPRGQAQNAQRWPDRPDLARTWPPFHRGYARI